jgi:hypothetical protein
MLLCVRLAGAVAVPPLPPTLLMSLKQHRAAVDKLAGYIFRLRALRESLVSEGLQGTLLACEVGVCTWLQLMCDEFTH